MLYDFIADIEQKELGLWQQRRSISLDSLKDSIEKPENNGNSFLTFFKEEVSNSSLKESTRQNHLSTLELLQEYKKDIVFTDLTFEFVSSFDNYLQSKGKLYCSSRSCTSNGPSHQTTQHISVVIIRCDIPSACLSYTLSITVIRKIHSSP